MELKLTRRRFGQLAIASTAVAGLGYLANRTIAQEVPPVLYGVRPNVIDQSLLVQALNLTTGEVENEETLALLPGQKVSGFTTLANGTRVLSISPVRAGRRENASTRLEFLGESPRTVTVSGLTRRERIDSLLAFNDGTLSCLIIRRSGRPPVRLGSINLQTGEITDRLRVRLPSAERFSNLVQTPNGTVYSTLVARSGNTVLVRLDLAQRTRVRVATLRLEGQPWSYGSADLAYSPALAEDEILILAAPRYSSYFNVYTANTGDGNMSFVREFRAVSKFTAARV